MAASAAPRRGRPQRHPAARAHAAHASANVEKPLQLMGSVAAVAMHPASAASAAERERERELRAAAVRPLRVERAPAATRRKANRRATAARTRRRSENYMSINTFPYQIFNIQFHLWSHSHCTPIN